MPMFKVQLTAKVTVTREIVIEAPDEELARKQALYEVDSLPLVCSWVVPGDQHYIEVNLNRSELDDYGTGEVHRPEIIRPVDVP